MTNFDRNYAGQAKTIEGILETAEGIANNTYDYHIKHRDGLSFAEGNGGKMPVMVIQDTMGHQAFPMTDRAIRNVLSRYQMPSGYFSKLPAELTVPHLEHWRKTTSNRNGWFIRAYGAESQGQPVQVRAALSGGYAKIDNRDILQSVCNVMQQGGVQNYTLVRPHLSVNEMSLTVLVRDLDPIANDENLSRKERGNFGFGFKVTNSEVGTGSFRIGSVVQRTSCTNSITFQSGGTFTHRHYGYAASKAFQAATIAEYIGGALQFGTDQIERLVSAESVHIPNISKVVADICDKHKIPKGHVPTVIRGMEGGNNLLAVVNGFSYAAHAVPQIDIDTSSYYSDLAGEFLLSGLTAKLRRQVDSEL